MSYRIDIDGDLALQSGEYLYRLDKVRGEARLQAPSLRSLFYLYRFRSLKKYFPEYLSLKIVLCLRQKPLATLKLENSALRIQLHPLRFFGF